ncbi:MAG: FAD-binding domain-containing protein, partial [Acidimicrobiales bacterium]
LPAVFVFDRPLLAKLQLSSKRLVFLVETLSELAVQRPVELYLGDPVSILADRPLAATFTPVPGWQTRAQRLAIVERHPWPWLRSPVA